MVLWSHIPKLLQYCLQLWPKYQIQSCKHCGHNITLPITHIDVCIMLQTILLQQCQHRKLIDHLRDSKLWKRNIENGGDVITIGVIWLCSMYIAAFNLVEEETEIHAARVKMAPPPLWHYMFPNKCTWPLVVNRSGINTYLYLCTLHFP